MYKLLNNIKLWLNGKINRKNIFTYIILVIIFMIIAYLRINLLLSIISVSVISLMIIIFSIGLLFFDCYPEKEQLKYRNISLQILSIFMSMCILFSDVYIYHAAKKESFSTTVPLFCPFYYNTNKKEAEILTDLKLINNNTYSKKIYDLHFYLNENYQIVPFGTDMSVYEENDKVIAIKCNNIDLSDTNLCLYDIEVDNKTTKYLNVEIKIPNQSSNKQFLDLIGIVPIVDSEVHLE